nr:E2 protein [Rodent papillomavirus]
MSTLEARFDAVQDQILSLYEKGSTDINDQIVYWSLVRKEGALEFCARKKGLNRLGMHTVPTQVSAEHKAKAAILMHLQLCSLKASEYGSEPWTMPETSLEMYQKTEPFGTFKKNGLEAEVYYDCDEENVVSYMVWGSVYKQDEEGTWHKYTSSVDYYGVFYTDHNGVNIYYQDFDKDSDRYGKNRKWTVNFKSNTFTSCPDSSSKETWSPKRRHSPDTQQPPQKTLRGESGDPYPRLNRSSSPSPWTSDRGGRGHRQREQGPGGAEDPWLSPEEVGGRFERPERGRGGSHGSFHPVPRDQPIILVKGPANSLKCWRNRVRRRFPMPFKRISTVFSWVEERDSLGTGTGQVLVAFNDTHQLTAFLENVTLPRGASAFKGALDGM